MGKILSIEIDSRPRWRLLEFVSKRLTISSRLFVVTPNPEIVLRAQNDQVLSRALNKSDIAIPDGVGIVAAIRYLSLPKVENKLLAPLVYLAQGFLVGASIFFNRNWLRKEVEVIKGREFFEDLVSLANEKRWRVFLLGGSKEVSKRVSSILSKKYPNVIFKFDEGPRLENNGKPDTFDDIAIQRSILSSIRNFKPHMLLVAFGAPKQEKWLATNLPKLPVGLGMAVGGTFNFIAGTSKIPPKFLSNLGLEWFWRLITEPWRIGRIAKATLVFPLRVFLDKLS